MASANGSTTTLKQELSDNTAPVPSDAEVVNTNEQVTDQTTQSEPIQQNADQKRADRRSENIHGLIDSIELRVQNGTMTKEQATAILDPIIRDLEKIGQFFDCHKHPFLQNCSRLYTVYF